MNTVDPFGPRKDAKDLEVNTLLAHSVLSLGPRSN